MGRLRSPLSPPDGDEDDLGIVSPGVHACLCRDCRPVKGIRGTVTGRALSSPRPRCPSRFAICQYIFHRWPQPHLTKTLSYKGNAACRSFHSWAPCSATGRSRFQLLSMTGNEVYTNQADYSSQRETTLGKTASGVLGSDEAAKFYIKTRRLCDGMLSPLPFRKGIRLGFRGGGRLLSAGNEKHEG